ncbi:MAG: hypothetical protein LBN96_05200 [Desulfovibrio sp.]|nr:hypothetical protein [Desulfovibrio sp.]
MKEQNYYLIPLVIVVLLFVMLPFLRKIRRTRKDAARRKTILMDLLRRAQEQNKTFDIKFLKEEKTKHGFSALLQKITDQRLEMEVLGYVSGKWIGADIDVYFRVILDERPAFYKFRAVLRKVITQGRNSRLFITPPRDLEVGQNRKFIRVKPRRESIRAMAVWHLNPARPLPRTIDEMGPPLFFRRHGTEAVPVDIENISSAGFGLRFSIDDPSEPPEYLTGGSHLLCLVIYRLDEKHERFNLFWSANEIVNSRAEEGKNSALVLGTAFTNWAMQGKGKKEINWFYTSPAHGVMPITKWVMRIDRKQRLLT